MTPLISKIVAGVIIGFAGTAGLILLRNKRQHNIEEQIIADIISGKIDPSKEGKPPF